MGGARKKKETTKKSVDKRKKKNDPNGIEGKKRHVQKLAREGKWHKIEEKYGSKMVIKAKSYAEKLQSRPQATVQSLARDILEKNGYGKYSHEEEHITNYQDKLGPTTTTEKRSDTTNEQTRRLGNGGAQKPNNQEVHTLTEKQKREIEAKRLAALARRQKHLTNNPTNQLSETIIPIINTTRAHGSNQKPHQYHIISPAEKAVEIRREAPNQTRSFQQKHWNCTEPQNSSTVSTIEDELKAAAEIIQWELEQEQNTITQNTLQTSSKNMTVTSRQTPEIIPIGDSHSFSSTPDFQILPPHQVLTSNMSSSFNTIEKRGHTITKAAKRPLIDCKSEAVSSSTSTQWKPSDNDTQQDAKQQQLEKLIKELLLPDSCFDTSVLEFVDVLLP